MANQAQTNGNLICIEHFNSNDFVVKSSKFYLDKSAVPSIFPNHTDKSNVDEIAVCIEPESETGICKECQILKSEISTLNDRYAAIEEEKLSVEDTLKLTIESQEEEIQRIRAKLAALNEQLNKSDFVRYALNDSVDPKVKA